MIRKTVKLDFGKAKTASVLATSCWHIGNSSVYEEGIHNFLKAAKKKPFIHHGDIIEGIMRGDRRFSVEEHKESVLYSIQQATELLKKGNKTCIGLLDGNHDSCPSRDIGNVSEYISAMAGAPYLSATAFLKFKCPNGSSTGFFGHGNGGSNPKGGEPERKQLTREIWLRNYLSQFDADICGIGHTHRFITSPPCQEEMLSWGDEHNIARKPVTVRHKWHYTAPSMFRTYDLHADTGNYGEMAMYGATDLGWVEIVFERDGNIACIKEVYASGEVKQERYPRIVG